MTLKLCFAYIKKNVRNRKVKQLQTNILVALIENKTFLFLQFFLIDVEKEKKGKKTKYKKAL